jgi:hypothetical protein
MYFYFLMYYVCTVKITCAKSLMLCKARLMRREYVGDLGVVAWITSRRFYEEAESHSHHEQSKTLGKRQRDDWVLCKEAIHTLIQLETLMWDGLPRVLDAQRIFIVTKPQVH